MLWAASRLRCRLRRLQATAQLQEYVLHRLTLVAAFWPSVMARFDAISEHEYESDFEAESTLEVLSVSTQQPAPSSHPWHASDASPQPVGSQASSSPSAAAAAQPQSAYGNGQHSSTAEADSSSQAAAWGALHTSTESLPASRPASAGSQRTGTPPAAVPSSSSQPERQPSATCEGQPASPSAKRQGLKQLGSPSSGLAHLLVTHSTCHIQADSPLTPLHARSSQGRLCEGGIQQQAGHSTCHERCGARRAAQSRAQLPLARPGHSAAAAVSAPC